jgi:death on curing protein
MLYLTFEEIIDLHLSILQPGHPIGFDEHQVRSVMGVVEGGTFERRFHPTVLETGAAYLFYFARNHSFDEGNKRTAVITCATFMDLNDSPVLKGIDHNFVVDIATGQATKNLVIEYLQSITDAATDQR